MDLGNVNLTVISAGVAAISALAAAAGLIVDAYATRQAKWTRELQIFDRVFVSIAHPHPTRPRCRRDSRSPPTNEIVRRAVFILTAEVSDRALARGCQGDVLTGVHTVVPSGASLPNGKSVTVL